MRPLIRLHYLAVSVAVACLLLACPVACRNQRDVAPPESESLSLKQRIDASRTWGAGDLPPRPIVGMVFERPDSKRKTTVDEAARMIAVNQQEFQQLRWIWFDGTDLTDTGFESLIVLPQLEVISVVDTNVSERAVKRFRQARSDCRVDHRLDLAPEVTGISAHAKRWKGVEPLWREAGVVPEHSRVNQLDVKQVYVTNTASHLFIYFRVRDTIPELLAKGGTDSFRLFVDTDNDPTTGSVDRDGLRVGYDFRFLVSTGTKFATSDRPQSRELFVTGFQIADGEHWYDLNQIGRWIANSENAPVAFNDDGVEMMLTLESLEVEAGQTIRIGINEGHLGPKRFAYERMFSERTYRLK